MKITSYRDRLLQVNRKNRSILLRKIQDKWCFDLNEYTLRNPKTNEKILECFLYGKRQFCLASDSDISENASDNRRKLKSLARNIIRIERETGKKELFVGYPFVSGNLFSKEFVRGPLFLFPIVLEYKKNSNPSGWYIKSSDKPLFNKALLERIRKVSGIVIPESILDEYESIIKSIKDKKNGITEITVQLGDTNDKRIETAFFNQIVTLLKNNGFPEELSSNSDIQYLECISAKESDKICNQGLALLNLKIIGSFPQGDISLYSDYEQMLKSIDNAQTDLGIIDNLIEVSLNGHWDEGIGEENVLVDLDEIPSNQMNFVIESDSSQDSVILSSQSNECTVVRGPPGTGKSQAIINMISDALSKKKKVLVVCQKRAALDVVYQRLDKVGLGRYIALLHDFNSERSSLYRHFSSLLETPFDNNDLNIKTNKIDYITKEIDKMVSIQKNIVSSLHKTYFVGINIHKLYSLSHSGYTSKINLADFANEIDYIKLDDLTHEIENIQTEWKKFDVSKTLIAMRKDFSLLEYFDKTRIEKTIKGLQNYLSSNRELILLDNKDSQEVLVNSLNILMSERGFLRKLKGNWQNARLAVKRAFNVSDTQIDDEHHIQNLYGLAGKGLLVWNLVDGFSFFVKDEGIQNLVNLIKQKDFDEINKILSETSSMLNDFETIQSLDKSKNELNPTYRKILDLCASGLSINDDWAESIRQEFFLQWIRHIEKENPTLRIDPFETYSKNAKRLSELLNEHRKLATLNIIYQIEKGIVKPAKNLSKRRERISARELLWNKLVHEVTKKKNIIPVRKLIEQYGEIIFDIAPCWMTSPETVSAIFPLKRNMFDLVIFDEASQSAMEKSLPALYRGKNIVILGDEKQLRPFDLFNMNASNPNDIEEWNFDSMASESLLVHAKRIYGYRYLTWHYRSRYQELINFSNHAFYGGHLQVAPNIQHIPKVPPIKWVQCSNGVWNNTANLPEAILVVDELKSILGENETENRKRSVGIITFNDAQREAILNEIDSRKERDTDFNRLYSDAEDTGKNSLDDLPFVLNIENVQGDERDIIIFSIGYAKDEDGRLHLYFGLLNQEGGENRLNVAITRAREKIVIVCSIDPVDLFVDNSMNMGPKTLKNYLLYSKFISENDFNGANGILSKVNRDNVTGVRAHNDKQLSFDSTFEELVYNKLKELNYNVDSQVGSSGYRIDLAVVHPDDPSRYILAIECDGASFHSAKSVRERDVMRQTFLESRGWKVERIWSKNWWRNSEKEIKRIRDRIEELRRTEYIIG